MPKINDFIKRFGLKPPVIIQAPMAGGITTPKLVAAVSNANALGSLATGYRTTEQVAKEVQETKKLTTKPFAVNLFIPNTIQQKDEKNCRSYQHALNKYRKELNLTTELELPPLPQDNLEDIVQIIIDEQVPIVSFTFGNLSDPIISRLKQHNIYLIGTATSVEEARILAAKQIDAVAAQGYEAGGHRGGFFTPVKQGTIGTMALIPQIVNQVNIPVLAAGGIMNGSGIIAAIALGASAVQLGTAFLTTQESGASLAYRQALLSASRSSDATLLTEVYSGKPARGIKTRFMDEMQHASIPPYPIPHYLTSKLRATAAQQNNPDLMSLWAGQGYPLIRDNLTVQTLLDKLREEAEKNLQQVEEALGSKIFKPSI